jgi:ubiquinone/menaquinone biosynthesis C-methylase UbiE
VTSIASNFIGDVPGNYDRFLGPRIFIDFAHELAARVTGVMPGSVLELAAGTGIVSRVLRDQLPADCSLVVTDLNGPMLEIARGKFSEDENIRFEAADAQSLDYEDASFDVIACQFGVMFFPDKLLSYQEALRVLKPGGRYIFNVWDDWESNPFAPTAHEVAIKFFPANPPGFYKVPFGYRDVEVIESAILESGFASVHHEVINLESAIPSARDFATGLVFGNPLAEEIRDRGGDPQQIVTEIAHALESRLGDRMPLQAIVFEASK